MATVPPSQSFRRTSTRRKFLFSLGLASVFSKRLMTSEFSIVSQAARGAGRPAHHGGASPEGGAFASVDMVELKSWPQGFG